MVLVGVQPSLMHVPPTCVRSTIAVRRPAAARAPASGPPPWPAPITIASYRSSTAASARAGRPLAVAEHPAQDLARGRLRDLVHHLELAQPLVRRHPLGD